MFVFKITMIKAEKETVITRRLSANQKHLSTYMPTIGKAATLGSNSRTSTNFRVWSIVRYLRSNKRRKCFAFFTSCTSPDMKIDVLNKSNGSLKLFPPSFGHLQQPWDVIKWMSHTSWPSFLHFYTSLVEWENSVKICESQRKRKVRTKKMIYLCCN